MPRGAALVARLRALPLTERDSWVDQLLGIGELPADGPELPIGGVPYLPASVEEIVALVEEAPVGANDLLVDIGAGVGRALILAHLMSGARAHGIEIQAPLVSSARATVTRLDLDRITFTHANAAETALDGSRFFLYAPCNGALLAQVLERMAEVAKRRPIVVATVGLELTGVAWLAPRSSRCRSLHLYDSL